jgi:branched-chain amino acid transport system ATP-binding protein
MQERTMPLLEVHGLTKVFGRLVALSGVDLIVGENEFRGLIGPNGSGKSTLLKCVAGAEMPTEGTIRFDQRDVTKDTPTKRARAGISLKFQMISVLPSLTVYDNVLLAMQARSSIASLIFSRTRGLLHERIIHTLEQFSLAQHSTRQAAALSHGQQQWLEIAMALACKPRLLLLDEPTAGMSLEERRITGQLLTAIKPHCSLVIVEHDLDFIRNICDILTVLDEGKVIDSGTVRNIQSSRKVQEVYLTRV